MAAEISIQGAALEVRAGSAPLLNPAAVGRFSSAPGYDATADGQRFLIPVAVGEKMEEPLTLIQNWAAGLKK